MKKFTAMLMVKMLVLGFLIGQATAATKTSMQWDASTTRIDGSVMAAGEIGKYTAKCGPRGTTTYPMTFNAGTSLTATFASIIGASADGVYDCIVTVTDIWGLESDNSNSIAVLKSGSTFYGPSSSKPNPPVNLR